MQIVSYFQNAFPISFIMNLSQFFCSFSQHFGMSKTGGSIVYIPPPPPHWEYYSLFYMYEANVHNTSTTK